MDDLYPHVVMRNEDYLLQVNLIVAPKGYAEPDGNYRSRFGRVWWFWLPRLHTQAPDEMNPYHFRPIWMCFALDVQLWGPESRHYWPEHSPKTKQP